MANIESDMGQGVYLTNSPKDAGANYGSLTGADLQNKIERRAEQIQQGSLDVGEGGYEELSDVDSFTQATEDLTEHAGVVMPSYVSLRNPVVLGGPNKTLFDFEYVEDEEGDVIEEKGKLIDFITAFRDVAESGRFHDADVDEAVQAVLEEPVFGEGLKASDLVSVIKDNMPYATDEEGNLATSEIIRETFEEMGFDGVVDRTVNRKWQMQGMDEDTFHIIAFDPTSVKSSTGNSGDFNPESKSITDKPKEPKKAKKAKADEAKAEEKPEEEDKPKKKKEGKGDNGPSGKKTKHGSDGRFVEGEGMSANGHAVSMASDWVAYEGPKGGKGWQRGSEIRYQKTKPGADEGADEGGAKKPGAAKEGEKKTAPAAKANGTKQLGAPSESSLPTTLQKEQIETARKKLGPDLTAKIARQPEGQGGAVNLTVDEAESVLKSGIVGFVSAGKNPNHPEADTITDEEIDTRYEALQDDLVQQGFQFMPVSGKYGEEEDSFFVMAPEADKESLLELGKKYNQDSVLYSVGNRNELVYTTGENEGKVHAGKGFEKLKASTEDFWTEYCDDAGTCMKFSLGLSFDRLRRQRLRRLISNNAAMFSKREGEGE